MRKTEVIKKKKKIARFILRGSKRNINRTNRNRFDEPRNHNGIYFKPLQSYNR